MTLINSTAYVLLYADATPSLPDPTTVSGRTHMLANDGTGTATWSSTGATPFLNLAGASVATITVARGATQLVYSNGSQWVLVAPQGSGRRVFSGTAVTNASGDATFTFSPAFAATPIVTQAVQTATTNVTEARITALTTTSCTVNVRQSPAVVILGISVLQVPQPLAGATVHLHAVEAGAV